MKKHLQVILNKIQQNINLTVVESIALNQAFNDSEDELAVTESELAKAIFKLDVESRTVALQNRELEIEAALEKVRNVALGLTKSEQMLEIAQVLYEQLIALGFTSIRNSIIDIHNDDEETFLDYDYSDEMGGTVTLMSYKDDPIIEKQLQTIVSSTDAFFEIVLEGQELEDLINLRLKNGEEEDPRLRSIDQLTYNLYSFGNGAIGISNFGVISEKDKEILKRFRNVFTFAYKRYSELIDAEKRAREAKIEASLEKVRSVALGLSKSEQMLEVAQALYEQLLELGFTNIRNAIIDINNDDGKTFTDYDYSHEMKGSITKISKEADATIKEQIKQTESSNEAYFEVVIEGAELQKLIETRRRIGEKDDPRLERISQLTYNLYSFGNGAIGISNFGILTTEQKKLLNQFRNVFTFAYTRYSDLTAAEKRRRETQIAIALERVRSRTLAMHNSNEIIDTAAVLFKQLLELGIEPNRLYIATVNRDSGDAKFWISDEEGNNVSFAYKDNLNLNATFRKMFDGFKSKKKSLIIDIKSNELSEYKGHLRKLNVPFNEGSKSDRRVQYLAFFNNGFIGLASPKIQPEETLGILEHFADVLNFIFTRFNDLKHSEAQTIQAEEDLVKLQLEKQRAEEALNELQITQKQLIQSEKMASLGELTAGIAHEIQNPLNFVNNFSEVTNELLDEMMEEVALGNFDEVRAILSDVKQNLEKINHHGKRADAIVKGMLQHSRASDAVKVLTDINKLVDEYLRLAYHGLRAKDKSFNATMKTNYDEKVGTIEIIPQDMGRAILNLITNAFYATNEKKNSPLALEGGTKVYEPTVTVSTKKVGDVVAVSVKDNGNGIPEKILDKIFQPFFTTKPTGKGTGLGLSLCYDIVKAHGGELKVNTVENEGSEFIISLSLNN